MGFDDDLRVLMAGPVGAQVSSRIAEFREVFSSGEERWFSELCFCLLTANAKQKTAAAVQAELGAQGFLSVSQDELVACLLRNKHRFHNNKSRFIVGARAFHPIRRKILDVRGKRADRVARDWLAKNVKGLGLKEASHFLRNVGLLDVAIIDRHILRVLKRYRMIRSIPASLSPKRYRYIEQKLGRIARQHGLSQGELDLYMWFMNTNEVLK